MLVIVSVPWRSYYCKYIGRYHKATKTEKCKRLKPKYDKVEYIFTLVNDLPFERSYLEEDFSP